MKHPELATLLWDHWKWWLSSRPVFATQLGYEGYDGLTGDNSPGGLDEQEEVRVAFLARARALHQAAPFEADEETYELFVLALEGEMAEHRCHFEMWNVAPAPSPVTRWNRPPMGQRVHSPGDAAPYLALVAGIAKHIDNETDSLQRGVELGWRANGESVARASRVVRDFIAKPAREWPLVKAAEAGAAKWPPEVRDDFSRKLEDAVAGGVLPALRRYDAFINAKVAPAARTSEAGLSSLPNGTVCYDGLLKIHTTLDVNAAQVRDLGLREMERVSSAIGALGRRLFGTDRLSKILARLRADRTLYFDTSEAIHAEAAKRIARAQNLLDTRFVVPPLLPLEVTDVPAHESGFSALALYRPRRGSTGAAFLMNTKEPASWPRYVLPVLVAHEALPGHHLQDGAMQHRPIPAFRKHTYIVPYIEGWGLYAEALADEMGFYESDLERLGMLLFDSWRTARLVVDTGIHAFGWTRAQAGKYLREHTILADQDVDSEVERYITQPGQAVAYKVGQLEISRLRREAEERLGAKFDVRSFHAALLEDGPTSLPLLSRRVARYIAARAALP